MNYWLFKSEPDVFSFEDLKRLPKKTDHWDGVRNYQARNFMRDDMKKGDLGFFYHSNCKNPGIVGIVSIVKNAYPDFTAFDKNSSYYDPKSNKENPRWFMVDVRYERPLISLISLNDLKNQSALKDFALVKRGNRLSVMPVSSKHWHYILKMEQ
ncbi:MAG: EVE domain-containing protein [Gammaproteobacteria bacterium]